MSELKLEDLERPRHCHMCCGTGKVSKKLFPQPEDYLPCPHPDCRWLDYWTIRAHLKEKGQQ
jgi:hypothetical protein